MDENIRAEIKTVTREIVESSVEGHRNYLTQIFERLIWALGIIAVVVIALFAFFVHGNYKELKSSLSYDVREIKDNAEKDIKEIKSNAERDIKREVESRIIQYRIVQDLKEQLNALVEITVNNKIGEEDTTKLIEKQIIVLSEDVLKKRQEEVLLRTEERVQKSLDALSNETAEAIIKRVILPRGAVLAFNRDVCPKGWNPLSEAAGRTIIGVGSGLGISKRTLMEMGGTETHRLNINEMPSHSHQLPTWNGQNGKSEVVSGGFYGKDWVPHEETGSSGQGQPHKNMPPFLALLYCQKA